MTDVVSIALSGLGAQQKRLAATASNVANASTSGSVPANGSSAPASTASVSTVYKPLNVSLTSLEGGGVRADIVADETGYSLAYDPDSPYANGEGMVAVPNVDLTTEMVRLLDIKNAFKANLAVLKTQDEMLGELLDTQA